MRRKLIFIVQSLMVTTSAVNGEEETHQKIVGEDSSFTCFHPQQQVEQQVYIDFIPYGSTDEGEQVFVYEIGADQVIAEKYNKNGKYKTDGTHVTIQQVELKDEGTYKCTIRVIPDKIVFKNELTVLVKPKVEEIVDLTNGELVDVNDSKSEKKLYEVAKCVSNGAKPQADVSWEFENNRGIEVDNTIELANQDENRLWMSSSILQITPERMYHNMKAVCVVRWKDEEPIRQPFMINVQYAPQMPTMKPSIAQGEVSCIADGNPEPDIIWQLPDGSNTKAKTVLMQDTANPNATYKCTAQNQWGSQVITRTNKDLHEYTEPVQAADMGIIIGVAVAAVLVLCLIGYLIYRFVLHPHHSADKDELYNDQIPSYNVGAGQRDHFIEGQNVYRPHESRKPSDDTDSEGGVDEPHIASQNSARYHQARRSNTNLRHSPSRGVSQEKQFDYIAPCSVMNDDDDMIDDPANRYADYEKEYQAATQYYQTANTAPFKDPYDNKQHSNSRADYIPHTNESAMV